MTAITTATSALMNKALPRLKSVQGGENFLELIGNQLEELGCVVLKGQKEAGAATNFEAYLKQGDLKDIPWYKIQAKNADASPHSTVFIPIAPKQSSRATGAVAVATEKGFNEFAKGSAVATIENNLNMVKTNGEFPLGNVDAIAMMNDSPLVKSGLIKSQGNRFRDNVVKEVFILNPEIDGRQLTYGLVQK